MSPSQIKRLMSSLHLTQQQLADRIGVHRVTVATMTTVDKGGTVTLQELVVTSLAQTDAVAKLLIEKGVITKDEFLEKIKAERATYQRLFSKLGF